MEDNRKVRHTARVKSIRFYKESADLTFEIQGDGMKPSAITVKERNDNPELNMIVLMKRAYSRLSRNFDSLKKIAGKEGDKWVM